MDTVLSIGFHWDSNNLMDNHTLLMCSSRYLADRSSLMDILHMMTGLYCFDMCHSDMRKDMMIRSDNSVLLGISHLPVKDW